MKAKKPATKNTLHRVYRGGAWYNSSATFVRAAFRLDDSPLIRYYYFGFRTTQAGCCQVLKGGAKS